LADAIWYNIWYAMWHRSGSELGEATGLQKLKQIGICEGERGGARDFLNTHLPRSGSVSVRVAKLAARALAADHIRMFGSAEV
jgi:hypothetical protein